MRRKEKKERQTDRQKKSRKSSHWTDRGVHDHLKTRQEPAQSIERHWHGPPFGPASLTYWLRRSPRELQTQVFIPTFGLDLFPCRVKPVNYKNWHGRLTSQGVSRLSLGVSQCGSTYNCMSRSVSKTHYKHVAGTLSKRTSEQASKRSPSKQASKQATSSWNVDSSVRVSVPCQ